MTPAINSLRGEGLPFCDRRDRFELIRENGPPTFVAICTQGAMSPAMRCPPKKFTKAVCMIGSEGGSSIRTPLRELIIVKLSIASGLAPLTSS